MVYNREEWLDYVDLLTVKHQHKSLTSMEQSVLDNPDESIIKPSQIDNKEDPLKESDAKHVNDKDITYQQQDNHDDNDEQVTEVPSENEGEMVYLYLDTIEEIFDEIVDGFVEAVPNSSYISVLVSYDSVMLDELDLLSSGYGYRLLEVDNRLYLAYHKTTLILVSSRDVLHSWAVPSLGLKTDACPGRVNKLVVYPNREGIYYGQCSEICGINHAYMPIVCNVYEGLDYYPAFIYEEDKWEDFDEDL